VNAYLREVIEMISQDFDFVVIDGEAGIEQINRRVMEKVTHLILVSDASRKGTKVIETIHEVADELVMYEKCGAIINRVEDMSLAPYINVKDTEILTIIQSDSAHAANDIMGKSIFELNDKAIVLEGMRVAMESLEI